MDASGAVDTSTRLTDYADANNPRGAVSTDGTALWVTGGSGGVRYATLGATTSTQLSTTVTNLRGVNLVAGAQLAVSTGSGTAVRVGTVGAGLPTTPGQTITNLPGFLVSGSPYAFAFAALAPNAAGVDTLYVADDGASASGGGIQKYALINGTWTLRGVVTAPGVRGLTLSLGNGGGGVVNLYAASGDTLYAFTDPTGYNGAVSGAATPIATAAANTAFRGVALAPTAGNVALRADRRRRRDAEHPGRRRRARCSRSPSPRASTRPAPG